MAVALQLANSDVQSALAWAQKLPSGSSRQTALANIVSQWSEADPQAAANFALQASELDGRKVLLENVSRQWAHNDPQAAVAWAANPASCNLCLTLHPVSLAY